MFGVRSDGGDAEPVREQVEWAKRYLSKCKPSDKPTSSYLLKGQAERFEIKDREYRYVSNGALIVAAYELGLKMADPGLSPNLNIFVSMAKG